MIRWVRLHSPSAEGHDLTLIRKLDLTCNKIPCVQAKIQPATNKTWHRQLYTYICFLKHKFRRICITFSNQNLRGKTHKLPVSRAETRMRGMQHGLWLQNEGGGGGGTKFYYVHPHLQLWKLRLG